MGNFDYSDVLSDSRIPDTLTKEQAVMLLENVIKETFLELFQRAFGEPDAAIKEKIEQSDLVTVKEWMSNIVDARSPEDMFVLPLERDLVRFTADVMKRNHGKDINLDEIRTLQDLHDLLENEDDESSESQ